MTVRESIRWLALDKELVISDTIETQRYEIPGTPSQGLVRVKEGEEGLDGPKHTRYRTGVGMLIYMRLKPKLCLNILLLCTYTKAKRVYRPIDLNWF